MAPSNNYDNGITRVHRTMSLMEAFFTSKGLDEHIRINGHNLYQPDNYPNHAFKNAEMDLIVRLFKEISGE